MSFASHFYLTATLCEPDEGLEIVARSASQTAVRPRSSTRRTCYENREAPSVQDSHSLHDALCPVQRANDPIEIEVTLEHEPGGPHFPAHGLW